MYIFKKRSYDITLTPWSQCSGTGPHFWIHNPWKSTTPKKWWFLLDDEKPIQTGASETHRGWVAQCWRADLHCSARIGVQHLGCGTGALQARYVVRSSLLCVVRPRNACDFLDNTPAIWEGREVSILIRCTDRNAGLKGGEVLLC